MRPRLRIGDALVIFHRLSPYSRKSGDSVNPFSHESDMDRLSRRVNEIYGERQNQPAVPPVYVVEPPMMPERDELDEARALVLAALRELPKIMLLVAALAVVGIRRCWLWLKQWKRTPQVG